MGTTTHTTLANTFTVGGLFAYLMAYQAEITILVLVTALALNITRLYTMWRGKR